VDTAELDKEIRTQEMDQYITHINALWDQYLALHHADGTWDTNSADLQALANDILDSNNGVFPQLVAIHDELTGEGNVSGSTMAAMRNYATTLVINGGSPNFASYMMIENYFGSLQQAQTRGATLMVEALKYREANTQSLAKAGAYPGDAVYFMTWYQKHIEDQVECFLQQTEAFVAKTAYPQKGFEAFVPDADKIFWRADLVAAWLSAKHRLDPNNPPDGQQFMVYRVIGGPDRVNQYGTGFPSGWGPSFNAILYNATGYDSQYSVPTYTQASHHAYDDLRPGTSPYVQFLHQQLDPAAHSPIADADEVWTGVYCVAADKPGNHYFNQPYYLKDIPNHTNYVVHFQSLNSGGEPAQSGEPQILYGHVFEMQHPPAIVMGGWASTVTEAVRDRLDSYWDSRGGFGNERWVSLQVAGYPKHPEVDYYSYLSGYFHENNVVVVWYHWAGSGSPQLRATYAVDFEWYVWNDGHPADRLGGMWAWLQRDDQASWDLKGGYTNVGSGTDHLTGAVQVSMAPGRDLTMNWSTKMGADWHNHVVYGDEWDGWQAYYKVTARDLVFTLPQ
jgi:hypothetical protein